MIEDGKAAVRWPRAHAARFCLVTAGGTVALLTLR